MRESNEQHHDNLGSAAAHTDDQHSSSPRNVPMRVLIAHPDALHAQQLAQRLTDGACQCELASDAVTAIALLDPSCDVVIAAGGLRDEGAACIADAVRFEELPARVILLTSEPTIEQAVRAMRSGVSDILRDPPPDAELITSVVAAAHAAQRTRAEQRELSDLRALCERFDAAHAKVADHLDALCDDLSQTCASLADQVDTIANDDTLSARLEGLLDVEAVLRAVLEHVLSKIGPTNAAIFLPGESDDFNLGAYVNYDCEKESADILLDHLADVLAPAFREEPAVVALRSAADQEQWLGDEAAWLADYDNVLVAACHDEDDCVAVIALFRDAAEPFRDDAARTLELVRESFTAQLSRISRVHHRLDSRDDDRAGWDGASDEDGGLAA